MARCGSSSRCISSSLSRSTASGQAAVAQVHTPGLTAFHDTGRLLGRAMARRLGWQHHVAWDTYFVYRPGIRWIGHEIPVPDDWYHQLKDREVWEQTAEAEFGSSEWTQALAEASEADPAHFATGADLRSALMRALNEARQIVE